MVLFAALCAWLIPGIGQLRHDDDVLAFLPPDHPDVVAFEAVAERYGMLDVALVGLRSEDGSDLLQPEAVERVRKVGRALETAPGVRLVLSFPDLPDPKVRGQTLVVESLVPPELDDSEAIRSRVLDNPNAVGNLISNDGRAAAMLVYLLSESGSPERGEHLEQIRATVAEHWDGQAWFGGGPFIEYEAATASREDIERLSPIVIVVLALASALLLRSVVAATLNLLVTGLGVALVVGAHGVFGEPFTIVSSTTPVMMVALGGAFGMHVIAGFQRQAGGSAWRASQALRELWWPVVLSGVTTATAFFALLVMPQVPMKRFGVVAGFGVLLLLGLALLVLPALLSFIPRKWIPLRAGGLKLERIPPAWLLTALAVLGIGLGLRLQANPDTRSVFDDEAAPMRADAFFNEHFGGSQFIQIAIETDLTEPVALRTIRTLEESLAQVEGVSDVRSLVGPVALLTEGFGGRRGVPETVGQARRVISNLADQSPMAQLMTTDKKGAIVHVKLAPASGDALVSTTRDIRALVDAMPTGTLRVGSTDEARIDAARREVVRARLARLLGRPLSLDELEELLDSDRRPEFLGEVEALRDRAFGGDELIEPLADEHYVDLSPAALLEPRGEALAAVIRREVPVLAREDPEGVKIVAEQLGLWIDEAAQRRRVESLCDALGIENEAARAKPSEHSGGALAAMFEEPEGFVPRGRCKEVARVVDELDDDTWLVPAGTDVRVLREVPFEVLVTGQPIIGQAFAQSVTESLRRSTLVSLGALALVLLLAGHLGALIPATWTLAVTAGAIALLGHPISIGTSMVSCIALGAGVDFAIHLSVRARTIGGPQAGRRAARELGVVVLVTGVQLAIAFSVLLASSMPPLRQFGSGLAISLLVAAAGAVWLTPRVVRQRSP